MRAALELAIGGSREKPEFTIRSRYTPAARPRRGEGTLAARSSPIAKKSLKYQHFSLIARVASLMRGLVQTLHSPLQKLQCLENTIWRTGFLRYGTVQVRTRGISVSVVFVSSEGMQCAALSISHAIHGARRRL